MCGLVPAKWASFLELSTLEPLRNSCVSKSGSHRHSDLVWRFKLHDEWHYIYLLLEFQSSVDNFMAVRMMTYLGCCTRK
ncbi:MAG: Rpn family recombination-promoting nuclease/putative transposase [Deltaproteobacteria bacterium]|nr:Rpn family recombination-promoting nuclease/putative transposase [Deltaproteobacteria bacterium]